MSRIALCHFRIGETDGVSLEMEKWKLVLERLGHQVVFIGGNPTLGESYVIPGLNYRNERNECILEGAFHSLDTFGNAQALETEILSFADELQHQLEDCLVHRQIDILVPNNILSLGFHLSAGLAFKNAIEKLKIPTIAHHHDFHWERDKYSHPTCQFVKDCLAQTFPPSSSLIQHVVINGLAQTQVKQRVDCDSTIVPNVFDFEQPPWQEDAYNQDFREKLGIAANDLLVLQATRIAERKTIELAIDFLAVLQQPQHLQVLREKGLFDGRSFTETSRIKFVLAGMEESSMTYLDHLKAKAADYGIDMIFANHLIEANRSEDGGNKFYSLWDSYVSADLVTYPSILEGWGNQLLEAMFAQKPVVLYEYPVYQSDLAQLGFQHISLGGTHQVEANQLVSVQPSVLEKAVQTALPILTDPTVRQQMVEQNYQISQTHFSYKALEKCLTPLFAS